jgi:hypothetical protein
MRALIGASAVLIAWLTSPGAAFERAQPDPWAQSLQSGGRLAQTPTVELPVVRVSGVSGTPIALNLLPPSGDVRFVKITDFPDQIKITRGFRLQGAWITSAQDLEKLELITPPGLVKTVKLDVLYFRDNQAPAAAQGTLIIELTSDIPVAIDAPRQDAQALPAPPNQPPATQIEARPARRTLSADKEIESLERGAKLMRNGDIAAARLLYEDIALSGSAKGARALAETYDPVYLKGVFIAGLRPNTEKAKIWYAHAAELGDTVSITRLGVLAAR